MANPHSPSDFRVNPFKVLRLVLVLMGLFLVVFLERRNSKKYSMTTMTASCPPCSCDCISEPTLSLPLEAIDSSLADCGKDDPEANKEMSKDIVALLKEELALHENVTSDSLRRTNALIMDAKKTSAHYQKESEKCNIGVETCEEAREKAQVQLTAERKLTDLWMSRAHQYGWKEDNNDNL